MLTSQQLHALQFCLGEFKRISGHLFAAQLGCAGVAEVILTSGLPITPISIDYEQTNRLLCYLHDQLTAAHYDQLFPGAIFKSKFDQERAVSPQPTGEQARAA